MSETFGRYTAISQLGRGAMGVVYLASDPMLNRQVAVKTVDLAVQEPEEREFLRERLFRDARAAAVLKHPNIVAIYDVFEDAGRAYVVMEYIEGQSLAALLKANPFPDVTAMLKVLHQMADALDYTHSRGVIHRDIKPGNVMIDSTGTTKIMDFGIARISDTRTCTPTGMVMGTVEYMAPEQILGETLDGRADQFALAVVAYQMMTGSTLFGPNTVATLTYKIVNEAPAPPCMRNGALPRGVDAVLAKALSKKPADRFANCTEFEGALARAFLDAPTAPLPAPTAQVTAMSPQATAALQPSATVIAQPAHHSHVPLVAALIVVVLLAGALAAVILKPWVHKPAVPVSTAAVSPPATAPPEPLPTTGPEALKPPAGATPASTAPAQSAPATQPQPSAAVPAPPTATPAAPATSVPQPTAAPAQSPPANSPPARTVAPPAQPASQNAAVGVPPPAAVESLPEDIPMAPPEPKIKSGPSPFQQAMLHGQQQVKAKDYLNALHSFGDAVQLRPDSAEARYSRGVVFEHFQQVDAAMRDFNDAIRLEPSLIMAHTQLGVCLAHEHHDPEALAEFQRALQLNPRAPLALLERGNLYLRHKQFAPAIADYNLLLETNPKYAPAYHNRAVARQAVGDFAGAAADKRVEQSLRQ